MKKRYHIETEISNIENPEFTFFFKTNPLQVGNLFDSHWNQTSVRHPTLRTSLFEYYLENGWTHPSNHKNFVQNKSVDVCDENDFHPNTNNPLLKQVMLGAAARGDIAGMSYLFNHHRHHHHYHLFYHNFKHDTDLCTVAGAAGRLEALKWLICEQKCKWIPEDVYREASENLHTHVMMFVEQLCYENRHGAYRENNEDLEEDDGADQSVIVGTEYNAGRMNVTMPYGEGMPW